MKKPPEWHQEASALRAQGMSPAAIAEKLGRNKHTVRWVLNNGPSVAEGQPAPKPKAAKAPTLRPDNLDIARRFNAGEFDLDEMKRRLRGEVSA